VGHFSFVLASGINKQLDLQSALTETGRVLTHYQVWFEQRQLVQLAFIALVAIICLIAAIALLLWTRSAPTPTRLALIGTSMVLGFVLICAASFHPRRPIYWPKNFGAPLELDTRNERNQLGPLCKPVASSWNCKIWLKFKNPEAPAVKREAEEDWGKNGKT
jgi:hypothetical protein